MTIPTYMPEEAVVQRGVDALMAALGPIETARFLRLSRDRIVDYVEWHRHWQQTLDRDAFLEEVFGPANDATDLDASPPRA